MLWRNCCMESSERLVFIRQTTRVELQMTACHRRWLHRAPHPCRRNNQSRRTLKTQLLKFFFWSCSSCSRTLCPVNCWDPGLNQRPWYQRSHARPEITATEHISTASIVLIRRLDASNNLTVYIIYTVFAATRFFTVVVRTQRREMETPQNHTEN